jgi:cation transport regulator
VRRRDLLNALRVPLRRLGHRAAPGKSRPTIDNFPRTLNNFVMPYAANEDLPDGVRHALPHHAQDIYRAAFNNAFESYADDPRREEIAHRVAWAAVKKRYVKRGAVWVARKLV